MFHYLKIIFNLPKFILINNLIIVFLRFLKFPLDIFGISFFALIIMNFISKEASKIDLTFKKINLTFINTLEINELVLLTITIFGSKFLISIFLNYNEVFISNKIVIFIQKLSLQSFFYDKYINQINQKVSQLYRNFTTEVKFCSLFITSLVEAMSNIIILSFALSLILFLIGDQINFLIIGLIFIPLFTIFILKKKLQKHGKRRIIYNLKFYEFFHHSSNFLKYIFINNIGKLIIKELSQIKQDEWKSVYINKFIKKITPSIIEISVITFVLLMFYFNIKLNILRSAEFILFIIIMLRLTSYLHQLQININDILEYYPSYLLVEKKLQYIKKNKKEFINNEVKQINFTTNIQGKENSFTLGKNSKTLFFSKNNSFLNNCLMSLVNLTDNNKFYSVNEKNLKDKNLIDYFNGINFCDNQLLIFNTTLENNISLFSKKANQKKISNLVKLFGFEKDFEKLQNCENISSMELSKEIKMKICLCRILYFDNEIYIFNQFFDNYFFDTNFERKLFKYLEQKMVIILSTKKLFENNVDVKIL